MISPRAEQVGAKSSLRSAVAILNYYHIKWTRRKQKQIHRCGVFLLICMSNKELIRFLFQHAEHN
jgi:hypothetical protein